MQTYLKKLAKNLQHGDAGERTHYSALEDFLERSGKALGHECDARIEPRNQERGIPDFIVTDPRGRLIGHIEAKDVGKPLDPIEGTDQLKGYLAGTTYPNLILTNYTEFRLFRNGKKVDTVTAAYPDILRLGQPVAQDQDGLTNLFRQFFSQRTAQIRSPRVLAERLAEKARVLRDSVIKYELQEGSNGALADLFQTFKEYLLPDLTEERFADIYAQTVAYGCFVARLHATGDDFDRSSAEEHVPKSMPLLRTIFGYFSGANMPASVVRLEDEIVDLLASTKVPDLLIHLKRKRGTDDPIVYFYEDFLATYDPAEREKRGVYYTPLPVVQYMVRSVHEVLKKDFGKRLGLADQSVHVLDPATGTATFPAEVIRTALVEIEQAGQSGQKKTVVNDLLKRISAFELIVASYVVGHIKLEVLFKELGIKMKQPFRLYLTNTLENHELQPSFAPMAKELSEETHKALEVKNQEKVLIIIANPPYSGHSTNIDPWIMKLMRGFDTSSNQRTHNYFEVDGKPLGERNPKWLNDDYVKFFRFAQWKIEQAGEGIVAFISNHTWLDNPTFRGMRQSLLEAFNEIFIYDLHGNYKKGEVAPDGSKDENVFDIQQGVAITFLVKRDDDTKQAKVFRNDLYGTRENKYETLSKQQLSRGKYSELKPAPDAYLFVPQDSRLAGEYTDGFTSNQAFPLNNVGMVTARDRFVIDFDKVHLQERVRQFADGTLPPDVLKLRDTSKFKIAKAREKLINESAWQNQIMPVAYRPFDNRWVLYDDAVIERPRRDVMQSMLSGDNVALVTTRQLSGDEGFYHALVSGLLTESCFLSNRTKEINYVFPLWRDAKKTPNIDPGFATEFRTRIPRALPEQIFAYIYGVLYAPKYRQRYKEFLRRDFPRVLWPTSPDVFKEIARLGQQLIDLHLMKKVLRPNAKFVGEGSSRVEKVRRENNSVWISDTHRFEPVSEEIWQYRIGGYQVLDKWLKSHKGRELSLEDTVHFCTVTAVLEKTIETQQELDKVVPDLWKSHG